MSATNIVPTAAPHAEVVINELGGNKLDYYPQRDIEYVADGCDGDTRMYTITIQLANTAPNTALHEYAADSLGLLCDPPVKAPSATSLASVRLIGTKYAKSASAFANSKMAPVATGMKIGYPTFYIPVAIPSEEFGDLTLRLSEPTSRVDSAYRGLTHAGGIGASAHGITGKSGRALVRQSRQRSACNDSFGISVTCSEGRKSAAALAMKEWH